MPRLAANLSMMYTEVEFPDRFAAAARDGFKGVEFLFPYAWPAADVAEWRAAAGVEQALFNMPPGDWGNNERGLACLPGRETEFRENLGIAIEYARTLDCRRVHAMAGLRPVGATDAALYDTYVGNLSFAASEAAKHGIDVVIEPINTRDIPGYFLNRQADAHKVLDDVGAPNLKVQMDFYHCQIVEGDLAIKIRRYADRIGHFQIAGVPDRHEPDRGEVNYPYLFDVIDEVGYEGWIGCEYRPKAGTSNGLGWARAYGIG